MSRQDEAALRRGVVESARRMEAAGHSPGTSGNVSARLGDEMWITPTGVPPGELEPADVVRMDFEGAVAADQSAPSSEWPMHGALYAARPGAGAVVHCHSRFATILACTGRGIPAIHYMIAAVGGFDVPCAPYATFGTRELSDHILAAIGQRNACLLANHGQVAVGASLAKAVGLAEEVERLAEIYYGALTIGGAVVLSDEQMQDVIRRFLAGYGQPGRADASTSSSGSDR